MLTTPHVLVALTIVKLVPNPLAALLLCLLSHFLIDFFIPHWNPHLFTEFKKAGRVSNFSITVILADGFLALGLLGALAYKTLPNYQQIFLYGLGTFFGVLPDLIEVPHYFLKWQNNWMKKYVDFQHKNQSNGNAFWGVITQLLVIAACLKQLFF
jgi:hypothetical protein